ncbi:MAG: DivIVA domain-containing protein [bacterium]|nr:DivIVA domain-containing protein [bacterium]
MKVTPLDIQQQTFRRRIRGYDFREVEEFLNLLRDEFEGQILENQKLKEELIRLKNLVDEYRSKEDILKSAIITAQKITEDVRANSLKEARIVLSEAELKAEDIIREAQVRLGEILNEIKELKRQKLQFETNLRSEIDTHLKLLEAAQEQIEKVQAVEEKLRMMQRPPRVLNPAPPAQKPEVKLQAAVNAPDSPGAKGK